MSDKKSLAAANDINYIVLDEIFEERINKLEIDALNIYDTDKITSSVLPHLAEQYHITGNEGWLQADSEDKKRELIKNAIKFHRYRGTKYSVIQALKTAGYDAELSEWFQYNGNPFFFKVNLDLGSIGIDDNTRNLLIDLVNYYKNVRSWLESLDTTSTNESTSYSVCITSISRTIEVKP